MLLATVFAGPFRRRERWSWKAVAASLAVWFAADTALSLAAGFPENAVLNVLILAGFAPGLAFTFGLMESNVY